MKPPIAYQNGQFVPATQLSIPAHDAGFVWGATVTDRVRTFNGKLFRLDEHLRRFRKSCDIARVELTQSNEQLAAMSERLIRANTGTGDVSVVWIATPGPLQQFAAGPLPGGSQPTLIAYTLPIDPSRGARLLQTGISLACVPTQTAINSRIKHRSRLAWWIASQKVHDRDPEAQPLFIDAHSDFVLETPSSNLLAVFGDWIVSPPPGCVLEGVSLGVMAELCEKLGLRFARREIEREELSNASELLLTNTTDCIVGVSRLDEEPVLFPGPVLNRLIQAWSDLVGVDLRNA